MRTPASVVFCLAPLVTVGIMSPLCVGYVYLRLRLRRLLVLWVLTGALLLSTFGFVNHSEEGSATGAVGLAAALLNAIGGTAVCLRERRALLAAG